VALLDDPISSSALTRGFVAVAAFVAIKDAATGTTVPNPLAQFDGCFDVYDSRTSTTR